MRGSAWKGLLLLVVGFDAFALAVALVAILIRPCVVASRPDPQEPAGVVMGNSP